MLPACLHIRKRCLANLATRAIDFTLLVNKGCIHASVGRAGVLSTIPNVFAARFLAGGGEGGGSRGVNKRCFCPVAGAETHTRTVSHGGDKLRFYGDARGNCGSSRRIQGGVRFGSVWALHVKAILCRCDTVSWYCNNYNKVTTAKLHLVLGGHARATLTSRPFNCWGASPHTIYLSGAPLCQSCRLSYIG